MEWKLTRLANRAAKNEQRDQSGARPEQRKSFFEATISAVIKEKGSAALIKPEHSQKQPEVTDSGGDERFLGCCRGTGSVDPKPDEQIGSEPDQFPANKEQEQAV